MANSTTPSSVPTVQSGEMRQALLNGVKLSLSLFGTILVGLGFNMWLPRQVGPEQFGQLNFADALATTLFAFSTFGVDTYIRKEISAKPAHASDFYAGLVVLRLAASLLLIGAMASILWFLEKDGLIWRLSFLYALGQACLLLNFSESALLHAVSQVNELAWMNVVAKLIWAGGVIVSLLLGFPLESVALWFFLSECIRLIVLTYVVHRHLHLTWQVNMTATWLVLAASFPFFLNNLAHRMYEKLNMTILSAMSSDYEVGWYGGASRLAGISLLFIPIVQAVVIPMAARTARQSAADLDKLMRGVLRWVFVLGGCISLVVALHADFWVHLTIGSAYEPSVRVLQILAPMLTLTYLAVLGAIHLVQANQIWVMIRISLLALLLNPLLNVPFIYAGIQLGQGWAGAMSAVSSVLTEGLTVVMIFAHLGARSVDRSFFWALFAVSLTAALLLLFHVTFAPLGLLRLPLEAGMYILLVTVMGVLPWREMVRLIRSSRQDQATIPDEL